MLELVEDINAPILGNYNIKHIRPLMDYIMEPRNYISQCAVFIIAAHVVLNILVILVEPILEILLQACSITLTSMDNDFNPED